MKFEVLTDKSSTVYSEILDDVSGELTVFIRLREGASLKRLSVSTRLDGSRSQKMAICVFRFNFLLQKI
jgi:hypothetical protein